MELDSIETPKFKVTALALCFRTNNNKLNYYFIKPVVDDCTLCDMCFITKCPYVPPHELDVDFPHLMLRYRAIENKKENEEAIKHLGNSKKKEEKFEEVIYTKKQDVPPSIDRRLEKKPHNLIQRLYSKTDAFSPFASALSFISNKMIEKKVPSSLWRSTMEKLIGIDKRALLPSFVSSAKTFTTKFSRQNNPKDAHKKVVLYATCFVNWNKPHIGHLAAEILRKSGVEVEVCFPECCGMPQLEQGLVGEVSKKAVNVSKELVEYVDKGYAVVSLTPSCTLMIKQEWPLLLSGNEDVKKLSVNTFELSEFLVKLHKENLLPKPTVTLSNVSVTLHHACHSRAQNMGFKAKELLSILQGLKVTSIERCSGHGGTFGFTKSHRHTAVIVGLGWNGFLQSLRGFLPSK